MEMKNFVDCKWLKDNLKRDNLLILDARGEIGDSEPGKELYKAGHIPGAVQVDLATVVSGPVREHGGRTPLPDMNDFAELMKAYGVSDDSPVVIYDEGELSNAGRLWWMLKYIGKSKVYVLAGGYNRWLASGGEISQAPSFAEKAEDLAVNIQDQMLVDMVYTRDSIGKAGKVLVDSRGASRFSGEVISLDNKAGRIPSAVNYSYDDLIKDGKFPTLGEIEEHFKALKDVEDLIVYCGSGVTATVNIMFMKEIGLEPKMYLGSFSDWITYDENEVESDY